MLRAGHPRQPSGRGGRSKLDAESIAGTNKFGANVDEQTFNEAPALLADPSHILE